MTDWQPIGTAPKDGTKILTFGMGHGNRAISHHVNERPFPMQSVAFWAWHDDERDVEVSPGLYKKEPCRVLEGWRTDWGYTPTHWMPLPSAPAIAMEAGTGETAGLDPKGDSAG